MNNLTSGAEGTNIQLPPIGDILKGDIAKYKELKDKSPLKDNLVDIFLNFIGKIATKEESIQKEMLENPIAFDMPEEFSMYCNTFSNFLEIYGANYESTAPAKSLFDMYNDIILKTKIDYIKKTKSEIADAIDPENTHKIFIDIVKKNKTEQGRFEDVIDILLNSGIKLDQNLEPSKLTIKQIIDMNKSGYIIDIKDFYENIIKPYLLNNLNICQNYISKSQNNISDLDQQEIYDEDDRKSLKKGLIKSHSPIRFNYDHSNIFAWPIINDADRERLYDEFMDFISDNIVKYSLCYDDIKTPHINKIETIYSTNKGKSISPIDYIDMLIDEYNDNLYQDDDFEDEDREDDDFENEDEDDKSQIDEQIASQLKNLENLDSENLINNENIIEEMQKEILSIISKVKSELVKYYQLELYISYNDKKSEIYISPQLFYYNNNPENKTAKYVGQKPTIVMPVGKDERYQNNYGSIISLLDILSANNNCMLDLGISNLDDTSSS